MVTRKKKIIIFILIIILLISLKINSGEIECDGSTMSNDTYVTITGALLVAGNYTPNLGNISSGQEQVYFCLTEVNSSLIAQPYSSSTGGQWIIQIT